MSQGVANTVTLYDKDGNPVVVRLENGEHKIMSTDDLTHEKLDQAVLLLAAILERMQGS